MMNDYLQQEEALFDAARRMPDPRHRSSFIDGNSAGNSSVRARIDELLSLQDEADRLFRPISYLPVRREAAAPHPLEIGSTIGRYKLIERIGEGGCGVVYKAEQQSPVRRTVAVKIIKAGMDTTSVIARFEAERQALAMMDHSNIAKIFDAGATETGRPYFVIELFEGKKITEYSAEHRLSINDRLELFLQICDAVQHAHQKGIIHRDLKPSNILISHSSLTSRLSIQKSAIRNPQSAIPKVIDFGIAKAIQGKLTSETIDTLQHQFLGTPAYMSPEQADLSPDIDTRTDIYSLGVLLYELLTGRPPFENQELLTAGLDEMRRVIREIEPRRPSHVLLPTHLPTDLDWIVMKCLDKDRSRRYETASALAGDVQRYLRSETIVARPPTAIYRLTRFARRNRLAFASTGAITVALLVGICATSWQAVRARRAERAAREEAEKALRLQWEATQQARIARDESERAKAVEAFLKENMGFDPHSGAAHPEATYAEATRILVQNVARNLDGKFQAQPAVEAEIRSALTTAFSSLRDFPEMARHARKDLEIRTKLYGPADSNTLRALAHLAYAEFLNGRKADAYELLQHGLKTAQSTAQGLSIGGSIVSGTLGLVLSLDQETARALPYVREAVATHDRILGATNILTIAWKLQLAGVTEEAGHVEEAKKILEDGISQSALLGGSAEAMGMHFRFGIARMLLQRGDTNALPIIQQVVAFRKHSFRSDAFPSLDAQFWLGRAYELQHDILQASKVFEGILPLVTKKFPYHSARYLATEIAAFYLRHGEIAKSKALLLGLAESFKATPPDSAVDAARLQHVQALLKRAEEATQTLAAP